jgi:hypothetical protein
MSDIDSQIARRIEAFVVDLDALLRRSAMDAVAGALGADKARRGANGHANGRGAAKNAAARSRAAARPKGEKRPPALIARTTTSLLDHVTKHPGQRIEQIGKALRTATKDLTLPAKKLLADKKIVTKGHKRATTYYPA